MSDDPRIEAAAKAANETFNRIFPGARMDRETALEVARAALAAADAAAWRPVSEAGEHEQIIAYRCSWGSVVVSEGYPLEDGEWGIPGSAVSVEPIACQPHPTPPQEQE